jgi:uncharacterized protein YcbX
MTVKHLFVYPIKSMAGIHCASVELGAYGLKNDRHFMLVTEQGEFITQRQYPQLARFIPRLTDSTVDLTYNDGHMNHQLSIPLTKDEEHAEIMNVSVWRKNFSALRVGNEYDEFFSELLHAKCYLVRTVKKSSAQLSLDGLLPENRTRSFVDSQPILVIGTASLDDLNSRMTTDTQVSWDRFRPNVVVETTKAFDEDNWKKIVVDNILLQSVKRCARCMMININQQTAQKDIEPLKTLTTYRREENKVLFGHYFSPQKQEGTFHVGSTITLV